MKSLYYIAMAITHLACADAVYASGVSSQIDQLVSGRTLMINSANFDGGAGASSLDNNRRLQFSPSIAGGAGSQTVGQIPADLDAASVISDFIRRGVRSIHIPCGVYVVKNAIIVDADGVNISGEGACTILSVKSDTGNVFSQDSHQYLQVHDMTIQADVVRRSGAAIYIRHGFANKLFNLQFTNGPHGRHFDNIVLDGANGTVLEGVFGRGGNGSGVVGGGATRRSEDMYLSNSSFDGYAIAPVNLSWISGAYLSNLDLLGGQVAGVYIHPLSGQEVDGFRATNVLSDSNAGPGWWFTGSGAITEISLTNSWGSTNGSAAKGSAGLLIDNKLANNVTVSSSEFHNNAGHGLDIDAGTNIIVNGNSVFMNGIYGKSSYDGIHLGLESNYVIVSGNVTGKGPLHASGRNGKFYNYQRYGIFVSPGYLGHLVVSSNISHDNVSGAISVPLAKSIVTSSNLSN